MSEILTSTKTVWAISTLKQIIIEICWSKGLIILPDEATHLIIVFFKVAEVKNYSISEELYKDAADLEIYSNDEVNFEEDGTKFSRYIRFKRVNLAEASEDKSRIEQIQVNLGIPVSGGLTNVPFDDKSNLVKWTKNSLKELEEFYVNKITSSDKETNFIVFPEFTFPIGKLNNLKEIAVSRGISLIAGSYHDLATKTNRAVIIYKNGDVYEQLKFTSGEIGEFVEGNKLHISENILLFESPFGNWIVLVCRDVEHPDLRRLIYQAREIYKEFRIDYVFVVALYQSPDRIYHSLNQLLTQELYCSGAFANLSPKGGSFLCNLSLKNIKDISNNHNNFMTPKEGKLSISVEKIRTCYQKYTKTCSDYIKPPLHRP